MTVNATETERRATAIAHRHFAFLLEAIPQDMRQEIRLAALLYADLPEREFPAAVSRHLRQVAHNYGFRRRFRENYRRREVTGQSATLEAATAPLAPTPERTCRACGGPPSSRGAKYCLRCRGQGRLNARAATAAANVARWQEWRAAGVDPTHAPEATANRSRAIAASNRERPRRRRG